jgi:hypothetical protein
MMKVAQLLTAPNDRNDNPRRLYLMTEKPGEVRIFDEGYLGEPEEVRGSDVTWFPSANITATTYQVLVKQAEERL